MLKNICAIFVVKQKSTHSDARLVFCSARAMWSCCVVRGKEELTPLTPAEKAAAAKAAAALLATQKAAAKKAAAEKAREEFAEKEASEKLCEASQNGDAKSVDTLLHAGAPVDRPGKLGYTPLMSAASKGHAKCVELLVGYSADVDLKIGTDGVFALFVASNRGHASCVEVAESGRRPSGAAS